MTNWQPPDDAFVHIGAFAVDLETGELRRGGETVPMRPQPTAILLLLVRNAGRLVTRDEIRDAVWGGSVVEFDQGINACIRQIRATLDDDAAQPRYVETVPRRGYRFVAPVARGGASMGSSLDTPDDAGMSAAAPDGESATETTPIVPAPAFTSSSRRGRTALLVGVAAALLIVAAAWALQQAAPASNVARIAVVPLPGSLEPSLAAYPDTLTTHIADALERQAGERLGVVRWRWSLRYDAERGVLIDGEREIGLDYLVSVTADQRDDEIVAAVEVYRVRASVPVLRREYRAPVAAASDLARRVAAEVAGEVQRNVVAVSEPEQTG